MLHLGRCVSKTCTARMLEKRFFKALDRLATVLTIAQRSPVYPKLAGYVRNTTSVRCQDEDEAAAQQTDQTGLQIWITLAASLVVCVVGMTAIEAFGRGGHGAFVNAFSLPRALTALVKPMRDDFAFLNAVRVISMAWIVYGHTIMLSAVSMGIPVLNPTAVDSEARSVLMAVVMGGEYAVDTFFFMSGFLAMTGLLSSSGGDKPLTGPLGFLRLIALRFLRLSPAYFFTLMLFIYVLPLMGSGPYFSENAGVEERQRECANAWTNLVYLNNLLPRHLAGTRGCMGHTWYLAVDMQLFVGVLPLLVLARALVRLNDVDTSLGWWLRTFAPHAMLVAVQVAFTAWRAAEDMETYVQPICRMTPYVVGCATALLYAEKSRAEGGGQAWLRAWMGGAAGRLLFTGALAVTSAIVFSQYDDLRCTLREGEPATDCDVWMSFVLYGAIGKPRWSKAGRVAYISLTYLGWSLALAAMTLYGAVARDTLVLRLMSHPVWTPLARLTYGVYLLHVVIMIQAYTQVTAPLYVSPWRQVAESVAYLAVSFAASLALYITCERPCSSLLSALIKSHGSEQTPAAAAATRVAFSLASHDEEARRQPLLGGNAPTSSS